MASQQTDTSTTTRPPVRGRAIGRARAGIVTLFALLILLGLAVSAGALILPRDDKIANGVTIAALPVGGLTREDAGRRLSDRWEAANGQLTLQAGPYQHVAALDELGIHPDLDATLSAALALGRAGDPFTRVVAAWRVRRHGADVQPVFTLDADRAKAVLAAFGDTIDHAPIDATARWDAAAGKVSIVPEQPGAKLDIPASVKLLQAQVLPILSSGGDSPDTLTLPYREKAAAVTADSLQHIDTVLGEYTTTYRTSTANRASNVETAARALNGVIVQPGAVFSFNEIVGPRDASRGFKIAPVISGGQLKPGMGGGICQVSTTLYNAVLLANMGIVMRSHHSLPIHYAPLGQDATVSYGALDFRFRNTSPAPVLLETQAGNRRLSVRILGQGPAPKVTILRVGLGSFGPRVTTIKDPTLPVGMIKVEKKGAPGRTVTVIRVVGDGPDAVREEISHDRYIGEAKVVRVGTKPIDQLPTVTPPPPAPIQ